MLRQIGRVGFGSPPRAWGQWSETNGRYLYPRFTPTRVGTMWSRRGCCRPAAVHPHTRGDNSTWTPRRPSGSGSPPHAWGQCPGGGVCMGDVRFTPTRVGTIPRPTWRQTSRSVHPHTRGDNVVDRAHGWCSYGSPPHAWGQYPVFVSRHDAPRFTPTRVGTIACRYLRGRRRTVHPHTRGDNDQRRGPIGCVCGSPPHAWGQFLAHRRKD